MLIEDMRKYALQETETSMTPIYNHIKANIGFGNTSILVSTTTCGGSCKCIIVNSLQLALLEKKGYVVKADTRNFHSVISGWGIAS